MMKYLYVATAILLISPTTCITSQITTDKLDKVKKTAPKIEPSIMTWEDILSQIGKQYSNPKINTHQRELFRQALTYDTSYPMPKTKQQKLALPRRWVAKL